VATLGSAASVVVLVVADTLGSAAGLVSGGSVLVSGASGFWLLSVELTKMLASFWSASVYLSWRGAIGDAGVGCRSAGVRV
jgi:hypothetical protein